MKTTAGWLALIGAACALAATDAAARPPFSDERAGFSVKVRGETIPYNEFAIYVSPGEKLRLEPTGQKGDRFLVMDPAGRETPAGGAWNWTAPAEPGIYPLRVSRDGAAESMRLNVIVLVPLDRVRNGKLNGYTIGSYPRTPLKGLAIYKPPRGFVEVTEANADTKVSPHFTLGQFLCKQAEGYPKYVVLRERLLLKLEFLLQRVNAAGFRADSFHVMSGYRTPFYNAAIGNVKYSRHVWGGAADIFIDENPRDGMMDDLNKDGKHDVYDAGVLYDLIDGHYGEKRWEPYVGGLGRYKKTRAHGPFVHVDVRGFRARWGT